MFCSKCGHKIHEEAVICIHCGCSIINTNSSFNSKRKEGLVVLLLCFFLGYLGVHRFYTGHTTIGIVQLLTLGGCGIWTLIDFILIILGQFKDSDGNVISL